MSYTNSPIYRFALLHAGRLVFEGMNGDHRAANGLGVAELAQVADRPADFGRRLARDAHQLTHDTASSADG
jgi:hypothetical protein